MEIETREEEGVVASLARVLRFVFYSSSLMSLPFALHPLQLQSCLTLPSCLGPVSPLSQQPTRLGTVVHTVRDTLQD
jgi:hypothetical protein